MRVASLERTNMARIPIAKDVAVVTGSLGEYVENRSLLLEKYSFHKEWGLDNIKANDATRWSLMRISEGGDSEIARDSRRRRDQSNGRGVHGDKQLRLEDEARLADALANTKCGSAELSKMRIAHSNQFVGILRRAYGTNAAIIVGQLEGRMAINLADSLIQNAGIALDRLFGFPYIPGSAVKGICRHTALEELKSADPAQQKPLLEIFVKVFGVSGSDFENGSLSQFSNLVDESRRDIKGAISFLPAYPVNEARIVVDMTNVHTPDYYQNWQVTDLAKENPKPNPFPTVEKGAQFAFAMVLNGIDMDSSLLARASKWLEKAITENGVGAKTAAGYGWFSLKPNLLEELLKKEEEADQQRKQEEENRRKVEAAKDAEKERLAKLTPEQLAMESLMKLPDHEFAERVIKLLELSDADQKAILLALTTTERKDRLKKWRKSDKPNDKARINSINEAASKHNFKLP